MKFLTLVSSLSLMTAVLSIAPANTLASAFDDSWEFVCHWDCGTTDFEPEYGGHTVHGYSSSFFDTLPSSQQEAKEWAYNDFWIPAGCHNFSSFFARTVCFDTAFLHGVTDWLYFWSLYQFHPDDQLACRVIAERAAARDPNSPYVNGWANRDSALASLGHCNL
ncbi:MAG: hypothetical protein AAFU78_21380 [Cyanobacteria bacterium J06633_2]